MKNEPIQDFLIPIASLPQTLKALNAIGPWQEDRQLQCQRVYYDTFDWRLFNGNKLLYRQESKLFWRAIDQHGLPHATEVRSDPVWPEQLKCELLRAQLGRLCGKRRLFPVLQCQVNAVFMHLHDQLEKTVLRMNIHQFTLQQNPATPIVRLRLIPLRGYASAMAACVSQLAERGFQSTTTDFTHPLFERAKLDTRPNHLTLKIAIKPTTTIQQALAQQFGLLHSEILGQVPGIQADWDTEFLHQYRIAIRRARSLLSYFGKTLPQDQVQNTKEVLRFWGQASNDLRDLDVLLLDRAKYCQLLPESMRHLLDPYFDQLTRRRKNVKRKLASALRSQKFSRDMQQLLLSFQRMAPSPYSEVTQVAQLDHQVRHSLWRRYKKMRRLLKTCMDGAHEQQLHDLRIEAKKLRYALTTFEALFPPKQFLKGLSHLKRIQNILGWRHDLEWQRATLLQAATSYKPNQLAPENLQAVGMLAGVIHAKHQQSWDRVEQVRKAVEHPNLIQLLRGHRVKKGNKP